MLGLAGTLLLLIAILAVFGTLAYGAISAAPWVPMPRRDVERLLRLAQLRPGETFYDLGCGDARLLVAAAERHGVRAVGYELALVPYCLGQIRRLISPARAKIQVRFANFWNADLREVDAVVCFLTPYAMRKLEPKIGNELTRPGARFISYSFRLHSRTPTQTNRERTGDAPIYLYT